MAQPVKLIPVVAAISASIEGDALVTAETAPVGARRLDDEILEQFLRIKQPEDVLRFFLRHGSALSSDDSEARGGYRRQPLATWFYLVRLVGAIREVALHLNAGSLPPKESIDWVLGHGRFASRIRSTGKRNLSGWLRVSMASKISELLAASGLRPVFEWNVSLGTWSVGLGNTNLGLISTNDSCLGNLVYKLMLEVAQSPGFAFCSLCGGTYPPSRLPAEGRGNYCPTCRADGSMWRHLKQRQRAKRREQLPRG